VKFCKIKNKKKLFVKIVERLSLGTENLNSILGSKNCIFNKTHIGHYSGLKKKEKKFKIFFDYSKRQTSPFVTNLY